MLSQVIDGHECVVSYASRVLSRSERKYCATRREMLALVWAVHIFRPYLYGKRFTLRTDHNCLKWLHNFKEPEGQVARWLEALAEYDYEVVHRPGKQHQNADALSRKMCKQCGTQVGGEEITLEAQPNAVDVSATQSILPIWSNREIKEQQTQDSDIKIVRGWGSAIFSQIDVSLVSAGSYNHCGLKGRICC